MRPVHFCLAVMAVSLLALSNRAAAQHATANDIADGERAYGQTCVVCHGPDGNLIEGIDLGRGLFRRDYTDAELLGIIIDGIPNTPMPPNPTMSEPQAERIVAYLRTMADESRDGAVAGDARRGRQLFFGDGNCTDCHAVAGAGNRHGPDLSNVGRQRRAIEIEASLTDPAARVEPTGRTVSVTLGNGDEVVGRLLNHDTFTVQLIDTDDRLRSFSKSDLSDFRFVATPMPNYGDSLSVQEIADLVSYLVSLQGEQG